MRVALAGAVGLVLLTLGRLSFAQSDEGRSDEEPTEEQDGEPAEAAPAEQPPCDDLAIKNKVSLGFLVPMPGCPVTIHGDVGFGIGETFPDIPHEAEDSIDVRLFVEMGVLIAADEDKDVHLGPVIALAGLNDPRTSEFTRTQLAGLLHVRYWTPGDILTLETSVGPTVNLAHESARPGIYASFGPSIHGVLGVGVAYDHVFLSNEHRVMFGVQMTAAVAVYAACVMSGSKC